MKRIIALIVMLVTSFTLVGCGGTNYPGNVKNMYWISQLSLATLCSSPSKRPHSQGQEGSGFRGR